MIKNTPKTGIAKPILSFFDFDHTLISDDSQGMEIRTLLGKKQLRPRDLVRIALVHQLYKHHLVSSAAMVRACIRIYEGHTPREIAERNRGFHRNSIRPRYVPALCRRLAGHRQRAHICVILSASVAHLMEPAAEELGVDHLICTRLETDAAGKFTGRALGPVCVGTEKTRRAKELAKSLGADLSQAWAYSDHHADLLFLSAVGHPVAVNPTPRLDKAARKKNWEILSTR